MEFIKKNDDFQNESGNKNQQNEPWRGGVGGAWKYSILASHGVCFDLGDLGFLKSGPEWVTGITGINEWE